MMSLELCIPHEQSLFAANSDEPRTDLNEKQHRPAAPHRRPTNRAPTFTAFWVHHRDHFWYVSRCSSRSFTLAVPRR